MILAAVSFSDPMMLAGLLAALIPVALHLLNRIRAPVAPFPTLRFLRITAQKTARRRRIQQYSLLFIRVAVFAMVAMAVAAPLIHGGSAGIAYGMVAMLLAGVALLVLAGVWGMAAMDHARTLTAATGSAARPAPASRYWALSGIAGLAALLLAGFPIYGLVSDRYFSGDQGEYTGQSTAVVIILDNSHSMLVRGDALTRLARAKRMVRQLISETLRPAEIALVPGNPGDSAGTTALTRDTTRVLGYLDSLEPRGRALPMQERIRLALNLLQSSSQPNRMLVVISDFARPAFSDAAVFAGIKECNFAGSLQVVMMPIGRSGAHGEEGRAVRGAENNDAASPADVGILSFGLAEGSERPVVGAQLTFAAELINNGDAADVRDFAFLVDGKAVEGIHSHVQLGAGGTGAARSMLKIQYRLTQPGSHRFGLELENAQDAMTWDDHRELTLDVADQIRVLVIGPEDGGTGKRPRSRGAAFYFQAALAPFEGTSVPWSIQPVYRGIAEIRDAAALAGYTAVFVCDVPRIPASLADALGKYTQAGGRLVWVLGPSIDAASYNQVLLGQNRDLLPAPLGEPVMTAAAAPFDWVDLHSGLFANLFESQDPFRSVLVTGHWSLAGGLLSRGRALAKLADNAVVIAEHLPASGTGAAQGKVYTLLTAPSANWSNLGASVLLVPMALRMAIGDAGATRGETSFETGEPAVIHIADAGAAPAILNRLTLDVTTPPPPGAAAGGGGTVINVRGTLSGDGAQWTFEHTFDAGLYRWRSSDGRHTGMFFVNPPGDEADLFPGDVEALARESTASVSGAKPALVAESAPELLAQLERRSEGTSLMPGFLAMVLILAVMESLMANRHRMSPAMKSPGAPVPA